MFYLVATPIGNLRDITLRALDALKAADLIVCEDTRRTQKLLAAYAIEKPLLCFHDHSSEDRVKEIIRRLEEGETVALVSDAGMPVISDPGFEIVREAIRRGLAMEALPGASAVTVALAASGLPPEAFSFHGFLPQKSVARKKVFQHLQDREETLIFYESPYRLIRSLEEMGEVWGPREVAVARELTKKFEEIVRGKLPDVIRYFGRKEVLGEIVILAAGRDHKPVFDFALDPALSKPKKVS